MFIDKKIVTVFFIFLSTIIQAQSFDWESYGYAKYMFSISENDLLSKNNLIDNQVHLRLNNRIYFQEYFTAGLELRLRGFQGSSVDNKYLSPATTITHYSYNDLDAVFWEKSAHFAYGQIDRLFLDYSKEDWQVTLGRQRIAWGTSMVWNVVDLFNPQSVLDFDYEEKPGSDAIRIQYFTDVIGRFEVVYKPAPDKLDQTLAFLFLINNWDYDFYFIGALHRNMPVIGAAFTGNIEGAGFRGEFKATDSPSRKQLGNTVFPDIIPLKDLSEQEKVNISMVLSLDYTFPNSFYLHGEVLYNNLGKTDKSFFYIDQASKSGMLSPAKTSMFFETAYDLHPLIRGNVFTLINPNEKSAIIAPSLSWSVITNLDLYLIGLISSGKDDGEYAQFGKAFFLRTKYSF